MKATIRTLLSRGDEPAQIEVEDRENDGQRELLMNAYLDKVFEDNKYELLASNKAVKKHRDSRRS